MNWELAIGLGVLLYLYSQSTTAATATTTATTTTTTTAPTPTCSGVGSCTCPSGWTLATPGVTLPGVADVATPTCISTSTGLSGLGSFRVRGPGGWAA